ncbi:sensor histidine kinase [Streptomyces ureilyticus]|uniref:histidine kinase n=1 Tax=Streptomyces ureilyticus TaxID=1775131 RepID=A0ABX0DM74_9ACTN|nr:HAMP domain-containing sensor histidine kinase [Streptomyces ureilyticus]NGO42971.1 HAMP domain-containing histidine kinase [Streptomyces ureilyticus]
MRRRLLLLTGATTALVLAALLVPLTLLTRTHAADRATAEATARAQWMASAVGPVLADGAQGSAAAEQTEHMEQMEQIARSVNGPGLPKASLILADGTVVGAPAEVTDAVRLARTGRAFTYEPPDGGRVVLVPVHGAADGTAVVHVALSQGQLHDGVFTSWLVLAGIGAGLVLLGLVLADRLGARLVGATRSLAGTADRLAAGDLTARAEPAGPPELRLIASQLNKLAARIDELLAAERENAADLAHRLRTPVAALRLDAETLRDPAEAERIAAGVAALEHSVDEVIRRARRPLRESEPIADLSAVTRERTAFWLPLAEDQDRAVEVDAPSGSLRVPVPPDELTAALDALIGNVLDHTPQGTGFRVTVRTTGEAAELLVEDEGPGFPDHGAGPHPTARGTSGVGSTGLGLDIARRTAEEAGGTFTADNSPGARVTLSFQTAID